MDDTCRVLKEKKTHAYLKRPYFSKFFGGKNNVWLGATKVKRKQKFLVLK